MVITTTRVTQMHDIVKTLQDGPERVKEIHWSEGPWLGEELEKAWKNYYVVQGYSPFATCGNDQCRSKDFCVLTSVALPSTSPSSPLHAPCTPSTPGSADSSITTDLLHVQEDSCHVRLGRCPRWPLVQEMANRMRLLRRVCWPLCN